MASLSTHVLDTAAGRPAPGVTVRIEQLDEASGSWRTLGEGVTDEDGRVRELLPPGADLAPGIYRMHFETGAYFAATGTEGFYPYADVVFRVREPGSHYHVPLLLSPFGYTTYRGS